jgi:hypothetical protein
MNRFEQIFSRLACIAALAAPTLLIGCAAPGPAFSGWEEPPSGKAMLYVYRTRNFQPDMVYTVKVDGLEAGPVHHDGYLAVPIAPGERVIQVLEATYLASATAPLRIHAEVGEIYPIQYDTSDVRFFFNGYGGVRMYGHRKIVLRSAEQALLVLKTLNRSTK